MCLESKPSDTSREISKSVCYECQVIGSFCEYDSLAGQTLSSETRV